MRIMLGHRAGHQLPEIKQRALQSLQFKVKNKLLNPEDFRVRIRVLSSPSCTASLRMLTSSHLYTLDTRHTVRI
jgi:hypothetical protein